MLIKIINENAEHEHIPDYTFTRDGDVVYRDSRTVVALMADFRATIGVVWRNVSMQAFDFSGVPFVASPPLFDSVYYTPWR